eukprot:gnl/MRDRNA2_/MRDRNA2_163372_c0_seq1.p1 gnl/MRDRNA2_/MRDRNA2_163372_c0~~gnl/MRDRNA2_/MRDRNA2_163372_c0_seq1.p1  ORF type:complete len:415 (+),score=81.10 gnl/MRDRNA2_/MRDRNA2_163372_c0_seq1:159-1247(+)
MFSSKVPSDKELLNSTGNLSGTSGVSNPWKPRTQNSWDTRDDSSSSQPGQVKLRPKRRPMQNILDDQSQDVTLDRQGDSSDEHRSRSGRLPFQGRYRRPSGFDVLGEKAIRLNEIAARMDKKFEFLALDDGPRFLDSYIGNTTSQSPEPRRRAMKPIAYLQPKRTLDDPKMRENPFKSRSTSPEIGNVDQPRPVTVELRRVLIRPPENCNRIAITAVVGLGGETPNAARKMKERRSISVVAVRSQHEQFAIANVNTEITVQSKCTDDKAFVAIFADDMRLRVKGNDLLGIASGIDLGVAFILLPVSKAKQRCPLEFGNEHVGEMEILIHRSQNADYADVSPPRVSSRQEDDAADVSQVSVLP